MRVSNPTGSPAQATSIRDLAAEIAEIDAEIVRLERLDALRDDIRLLEDDRDDFQGQLDELELEDA
jgi:hypothetical protein